MARLWRNTSETREGKYLVLRPDGTVPSGRWFVMLDSDPCAPASLRAYAAAAAALKMDPEYVADVVTTAAVWAADLDAGRVRPGAFLLASAFPVDLRAAADDWAERLACGTSAGGDPDAPRHRVDCPWVVELMRRGGGC
jgi:hypothetical protein